MRKNFSCLAAMLFVFFNVSAQFNDSFSDGDFTANPAWVGNMADWQIVANSDVATGAANSNTLRLNVATGSGATYLAAQVAGSWGLAQSWGFFVGRRGQAYTAANHTFIWLWASEANLLSASISGYRVRIGDDAGGDDIILQKVIAGVATDILTSATALPNGITDAGFLLRVTRGSTGSWELFTSVLPAANGTGAIATDLPNATNANLSQGTVTDNAFSMFDNGHIGFVNIYGSGTAARAAQEFDQVQLSFVNNAMPVRLANFMATANGTGTKIHWDVVEETNVQSYQVQSSSNGAGFMTLGMVRALNRKTYEFVDARALAQNRFYRLKIIDMDGSTSHSPVVSLKAKNSFALNIIHDPRRNVIRIDHPPALSQATLQLRDARGKLLQEYHISPYATQTIVNVSALPRGWYCIIFTNPGSVYRSLSRLFTSFSSL